VNPGGQPSGSAGDEKAGVPANQANWLDDLVWIDEQGDDDVVERGLEHSTHPQQPGDGTPPGEKGQES